MRTRHLVALCSALAPFALGAGWLAGWALDDGQRPYQPTPVAAAVAPTTPPPVLLIETTAPVPRVAHTAVRTVVREVPAPPTTTPSTSAPTPSATLELTTPPASTSATTSPATEPPGGVSVDVGVGPPDLS